MTDHSAANLTPKGLATRSRIIDAAADLVNRQGVEKTSVDDIRKAAGVSGSQITHYFADKRELIRGVIAARRESIIKLHTQPRVGALDSFDALQAWRDVCVEEIDTKYSKNGCAYGSLAGELSDVDDELRGDLATGYHIWMGLFRSGLAAMRDRGDLVPEADPRHLAAAMLIAHQGGAVLSHATHDAEPMRAALDAVVAYVRSFSASPKPIRSSRRR